MKTCELGSRSDWLWSACWRSDADCTAGLSEKHIPGARCVRLSTLVEPEMFPDRKAVHFSMHGIVRERDLSR